MSHWCWPFLCRTTTAAIEQAKTKHHWLIGLLVARSIDWLIDWLVELSLSVYQSVRSSTYPSVCFRNYRKLSSFSFFPVWITWTFAFLEQHTYIEYLYKTFPELQQVISFGYICLCPERQHRETICACNRQSDPPPGTTLDIIGLRSTIAGLHSAIAKRLVCGFHENQVYRSAVQSCKEEISYHSADCSVDCSAPTLPGGGVYHAWRNWRQSSVKLQSLECLCRWRGHALVCLLVLCVSAGSIRQETEAEL